MNPREALQYAVLVSFPTGIAPPLLYCSGSPEGSASVRCTGEDPDGEAQIPLVIGRMPRGNELGTRDW